MTDHPDLTLSIFPSLLSDHRPDPVIIVEIMLLIYKKFSCKICCYMCGYLIGLLPASNACLIVCYDFALVAVPLSSSSLIWYQPIGGDAHRQVDDR